MTEITHLGDLTPDLKNARRHNARNIGMIERSLGEVGAARSIVIDETGRVLAGNGTIDAAAAVGIERVRVIDADGDEIIAVRRSGLTEEQKVKLALYDNRSAELAEWEPGVLAELAQEIDVGPLWTPEEWREAAMPDTLPEPGAGGDEFDTTPDSGPTRAQSGDLWLIDGGRHRLIVGDCTDPAVVARLMGGERAALCATDPPYNVGFAYEGEYKGQDNKTPREYGEWLNRSLHLAEEHAETGTPFFVWQAQLNVQYFASWFSGREWRLFAACKNFIQARPTWLQYAWDPVVCWTHGENKTKNHAGIRDWHMAETSNTAQTPDRVISGEHPCPRPVDTVQYVIESHADTNALVYDPFLGSGTTLIAAHRTGRRCYGCEIEPRYADVILRRCEAEGLTVERAE